MQQKNYLNIELKTESSGIPLYVQLSEEIKKLIRTGILRPGEALPGSRELSEMLNVSRKTVVKAMEILVFSGWVINRNRVGLFVTDGPRNIEQVSRASKMQTEQKMTVGDEDVITLTVDDGFPDRRLAPIAEMGRLSRQMTAIELETSNAAYSDPRGYLRLRESITAMLRQERGMSVSSEEICITRGSQMALYLIANAVLNPGDNIVMENPGNGRAYDTFRRAGLNVIPISIDNDGLRVNDLEDLVETTKIAAVYVTPRHQYPTTVTLSPLRRRTLAGLAAEYNFTIIEDDFCSHFQFGNHHLMPLSCQVAKSHYIYVNTFSKLLTPTFRMGYVVATADVIRKIADYRTTIDIQGDLFAERMIYHLDEQGDIKRHVRKSCRVYREKLEYLSQKINERLADRIVYRNPHGGLAIWIGFAKTVEAVKRLDIDTIKSRFLKLGVKISVFKLPSGQVGIRVGYATLNYDQIDFLIDAICKIV